MCTGSTLFIHTHMRTSRPAFLRPVPAEGPLSFFLPSKVRCRRPVAARFYGVLTDGDMKIRGLACRRRDRRPGFTRHRMSNLLDTVEALVGCQHRLELFSLTLAESFIVNPICGHFILDVGAYTAPPDNVTHGIAPSIW